MNCFIASPRKLFLIDALGATLTAALTVGVLARWTQVFGMPSEALYKLAVAGSVLAMYSFGCYLVIRRSFPTFLRVIALANLSYCVVTVALCINYRARITAWGLAYFISECLLVVALAGVEMRVATALKKAEGYK